MRQRRVATLSWLRRHPSVVDGCYAGLLASLSLASLFLSARLSTLHYRTPGTLAVVLVLLGTLPIVVRRRFPVAILVAVAVPSIAVDTMHYPPSTGGLSVLVALYTVAAYCSLRTAVLATIGTLAGAIFVTFAGPEADQSVTAASIVGNIVIFVTAFFIGRTVANRRAYLAELEARAGRLERARSADARAAVAEERARIARELHDVVAHHVSVMVVQAGAARRTVDRDPERGKAAMATIERTGREALAEMRRLLGLLREEDGSPGGSLEPQPGLVDLEALVADVRASGLPVRLKLEGERRSIAVGVDVTAYRIVQEALTNALKHAGPTSARVVLRYTESNLEVDVIDEGVGGAAALIVSDRIGHGLLGMRERVAMVGGSLHAGPRQGGGYQVVASIPLDPVAV